MAHRKTVGAVGTNISNSPLKQPDSPADTIETWLARQSQQDLLRFITCGSVDDGKSTLIGRMLWESQQIFDDQLAALQADSKRHGTQGDDIDFALLVDGLMAEREQGITIDVAYRFFSTPRRKFIVADTPGHEQYTRNMVTGASTAMLAILLVDARHGVRTQTRRHAMLASLMGIRHVALAINKMDLMDFRADVFKRIEAEFAAFAGTLGFASITSIPLSALKGDNITQRSPRTPWYNGLTLISYLESIDVGPLNDSGQLVFPVQWVNRPDAAFRGFSGTVAAGRVAVGDNIRVTASGQTARIQGIVTMDGDLDSAQTSDAVTLVLDKEIDASRGDVISQAAQPLQMTDQFEASLVWLNEESGLIGRSYDIKLATQWGTATITSLKYRLNVDNLAHESCRSLALNDIGVTNLSLSRPMSFAEYPVCQALGSFILIDKLSHATVAAGMIRHNLRRAQNVHRQALQVTRPDRERLNGHPGKVIWFTGLSGSGKSTLANALEISLHADGKRTYILDGDNIRQGLNRDLGFTTADRVENIRRIAEVAKLMMDAGLIVMTAFISPFRQEREMARQLVGAENFVEVFVYAPLAVCEQRDPKGLYQKARSGQLPNMTGINSPYEPPLAADMVVNSANKTIAEIVAALRQCCNI